MDAETYIHLLTRRGYVVENDDRHLLTERGYVPEKEVQPHASKRYLVFNPNEPGFFENDGSPDFFDEKGLITWVERVMIPVWAKEEPENALDGD